MAIIAVARVDEIFAVGLKSRCNRFRDELNHLIPVKNFRELRWFGVCHYSRDRKRDTLTISQKRFGDKLVRKFV